MQRPEMPLHITHALKKLGINMPGPNEAINIHHLDGALKDSGASLEQRLRFKSSLREARLINP